MKGSLTDESTRIGLSEKAHDGFSSFQNQILKSESKELALLKHKCQTLSGTIASLKTDNAQLRKQKEALLALNSEYIGNLNKFYEERGQSIEKVIFPSELWSDNSQLQPRLKEYLRLNVAGFKRLQQDHRNLVQHCLTMQKQIKNYKIIVDECHRMKNDLLTVNHTDVIPLVREIQQLANDNRQLRTDNNRVSFQCEKYKKELERVRVHLKETEKQADRQKYQLVECKSTVNRLLEEGKEQANGDEKRIYELGVKCNALEEQLRSRQEQANKIEQLKQKHQMEAVEFVHRETEFRKTLSEFSRLKHSTRNSLNLQDRDHSISSFLQRPSSQRFRKNSRHSGSVSKQR